MMVSPTSLRFKKHDHHASLVSHGASNRSGWAALSKIQQRLHQTDKNVSRAPQFKSREWCTIRFHRQPSGDLGLGTHRCPYHQQNINRKQKLLHSHRFNQLCKFLSESGGVQAMHSCTARLHHGARDRQCPCSMLRDCTWRGGSCRPRHATGLLLAKQGDIRATAEQCTAPVLTSSLFGPAVGGGHAVQGHLTLWRLM